MEIAVQRDDLSALDCGGGYRLVSAEIFVDSHQSVRQQCQAAIYETLGLMLDNVISHERLQEMTDTLGEVLDQLEGGEHATVSR